MNKPAFGETEYWFMVEGLNPEPWSASKVTRKSAFKSQKLLNYQAGLRQSIEEQMDEGGLQRLDSAVFPDGVELELIFWRNTHKGSRADVTNLIKSTEDALQSVRGLADTGLIENDRMVVRVSGQIASQSTTTDPGVFVRVSTDPTNVAILPAGLGAPAASHFLTFDVAANIERDVEVVF